MTSEQSKRSAVLDGVELHSVRPLLDWNQLGLSKTHRSEFDIPPFNLHRNALTQSSLRTDRCSPLDHRRRSGGTMFVFPVPRL